MNTDKQSKQDTFVKSTKGFNPGQYHIICGVTNCGKSRYNVITAKKNLYGELLKLSNEELTENEVDLMFALSKDKDIQKIMDETIKKEKQ